MLKWMGGMAVVVLGLTLQAGRAEGAGEPVAPEESASPEEPVVEGSVAPPVAGPLMDVNSDGALDLVVVEERSRLLTLLQTPRLFTGSLALAPGYSIRRIKEATIECADAMAFHVDGEPVAGGTRLTARVLPAALRVCIR